MEKKRKRRYERYERKHIMDYNFKSYYRMYKRRYKTDYKQKQVRAIIAEFYKRVFHEMLYNMYEFDMYGLFTFFIIKTKIKAIEGKNGEIYLPKKLINWKETNKLGTKVYYTLEDSNGFYYKLSLSKGSFLNRQWYGFSLNKFRRKDLSKAVKYFDGNLPAYSFYDNIKMSQIRKSVKKQKQIKVKWYQSAKSYLESANTHS